jgi:hypothetical protein
MPLTAIVVDELLREVGVNLTNLLYRLARRSADIRALASGDPRKMVRRFKNKRLGRLAGRRGVWSTLYGGGRRRQ